MANTISANMTLNQRLQRLDSASSIPGTPHTMTLDVSSTLTRDSITMYSVASSRTRDTDYGLYYTRRALSMTSDDYGEIQDRTSIRKRHGRILACPHLAERRVQMPIDESTEESFSDIAIHRPSIISDDFYLFERGERKVNPEYLRTHFERKSRLTEDQALYIIGRLVDICRWESNMVAVNGPVTVCGDINGQYNDLLKLLDVGGGVRDGSYVFLGNYVNGGNSGVECLLYLYALKLQNPQRIVLLRGRHEYRYQTKSSTFKQECLHKYSENVYEAFLRSFFNLPISAVIDGKLLCVHGGISPELEYLDDIQKINRYVEIDVSSRGFLCDMLCSGPFVNFGNEWEPTASGPGLASGTKFVYDTRPRRSYFYTYEAVCQFLNRNNLLTIIRGDDAQSSGYRMYRKTKRNVPSVITISSATQYSTNRERPNLGAILAYVNKHISIKQYVGDLGMEATQRHLDLTRRKKVIKLKILAVGHFLYLLNLLREDAEITADVDKDVETWEVEIPSPMYIADVPKNIRNSRMNSQHIGFLRYGTRQMLPLIQPQQPDKPSTSNSGNLGRRYGTKNLSQAYIPQIGYPNNGYKSAPQWHRLPDSVDGTIFDANSYEVEDLQKLFGELFQQSGERSSRARSRLLGIF